MLADHHEAKGYGELWATQVGEYAGLIMKGGLHLLGTGLPCGFVPLVFWPSFPLRGTFLSTSSRKVSAPWGLLTFVL